MAGYIAASMLYKCAGVRGGLAEIVDSQMAGWMVLGTVEIELGKGCRGLLLFAEGEGSCDCDDDGYGGKDKFELFHAK